MHDIRNHQNHYRAESVLVGWRYTKAIHKNR